MGDDPPPPDPRVGDPHDPAVTHILDIIRWHPTTPPGNR